MELYIRTFDELTTSELYDILKIRTNVFVVEQNCPYPELDDKDQDSVHVFCKEDNNIIAYLRVIKPGVSFKEAAIGRVLCIKRRQGIATGLLKEAIKVAKEYYGSDKIHLEAQVYVRKMYEKLGFVQITDEFLEDGIPHIGMILDIKD